MTAVFAMLAALCLYAASCLGGSDDAPRRDGDPALSRWAADQDAFWQALSARDDAHNAQLEQRAEVKRREGIYGAIDEYRAAHHESPRSVGDVRQDWPADAHAAFRRWARTRQWVEETEDGPVPFHPSFDDEDKEAEEAVRSGL